MAEPAGIPAIALPFYLGEFRLFTKQFDGVTIRCHFTQPQPILDDIATLVDATSPKAEAVLLRSFVGGPGLPRVCRRSNHLRYVARRYPRHYVVLQGTFDDYLSHFSGKTRSTLRRKLRAFARESSGRLEWSEYRTPEELAVFLRLAGELSAKGYQERLLKRGLPRDPAFASAVLREAEQDKMRGYLLFHGGRPVAYLLCPIEDGIVFYEHVGHDPALASRSPGTVLQLLVLEHLFRQETHQIFDFTEGGGPHKALFATDSVQCVDVYLMRRTPANYFWIYSHLLMTGVSAGIAGALDRLRIKGRLKKFIRMKA